MHYFESLEQSCRGKSPAETYEVNLPRTHLSFPGIQLPDPSFYVLKLVQAAVSLGARAIRVSSLACEFRVEADGCRFPDDFSVNSALMRFPAPGSPIGDLTVGLSAALEASRGRVDLLCCHHQKGEYGVITPGRLGVFQVAADDWLTKTSLAVRIHKQRAPLLTRFMRRTLSARMDEHRALWHRASLCPVPLHFDGHSLEIPPALTQAQTTRIECRPAGVGEIGFALRLSPEHAQSLEQPLSSLVAFGEAADTTEILWVHRGVVVASSRESLGLGAALAICCLGELELDRSHFALVRNQAYRQAVQQLRERYSSAALG